LGDHSFGARRFNASYSLTYPQGAAETAFSAAPRGYSHLDAGDAAVDVRVAGRDGRPPRRRHIVDGVCRRAPPVRTHRTAHLGRDSAPAHGLHVRVRSSKTDQEGAGTVRALPYGRDPQTCPPCALIRWRRLLLAYTLPAARPRLRRCIAGGLGTNCGMSPLCPPVRITDHRTRPLIGEACAKFRKSLSWASLLDRGRGRRGERLAVRAERTIVPGAADVADRSPG